VKLILIALLLACTLVLSACSDAAVTAPSQASQGSASIREALPNAEYPIDLASTGKAQLKDGSFEELAAPGSATKTTIRLGKKRAFGDVNGDGTEDVAVTLIADPGGSGTFTYLSLVLNEAGVAKPLPAVLLGDRITIKSMGIHPGKVVVTTLTRKPDEPMSAKPTVEETRIFELQGDELVEVKS